MEWPNLDCMCINDLITFANRAESMVRYARDKVQAMRFREAGQINKAMDLEATLERLYKLLPPECRW